MPGRAKDALALSLLAAFAFAIWGCGATDSTESGAAASVSITGLYPDFDPAEARYVSRCGRGAAAIRVEAEAGTRVAVRRSPASASDTADTVPTRSPFG